MTILKLYREGCKKCAALDPIFSTYSKDPKNPDILKWYQADAANVPDHVASIKTRLSGSGVTSVSANSINGPDLGPDPSDS